MNKHWQRFVEEQRNNKVVLAASLLVCADGWLTLPYCGIDSLQVHQGLDLLSYLIMPVQRYASDVVYVSQPLGVLHVTLALLRAVYRDTSCY